METRDMLLARAAGKPVQRFRQYDCFINVEPGDPIVRPDANGQCLFGMICDDLRTTGNDMVRVTIHTTVSRDDAIVGLRKIIGGIESGFWPDDNKAA